MKNYFKAILPEILILIGMVAVDVHAATGRTVGFDFVDGAKVERQYVSNGNATKNTTGWSTYAVAQGVTFTDAGDTVGLAFHSIENGTVVSFTSITTTTGISANTPYYVVGSIAGTSFQVSATLGGSALTLTTNGSGTLVMSRPIDCTGGSPSSTWTRSTSSPLRGAANFLWTKSANNRMGEGVSTLLAIDRTDQAKALTASFEYEIGSGTYADDDMSIWIYDVTNSKLIQPSAYSIKNLSGSSGKKVEFQTAYNSTSYRVCLHTASTSATAYTVKVGNVKVSPNTYSTGSSIGEWSAAFSPTTDGFGTPTTNNAYWRKVGGDMEVRGYFVAGTTTAVAAAIYLPTGYSIDSSRLATTVNASMVGKAMRNNSENYTPFYDGSTTTKVFMNRDPAAGVVGPLAKTVASSGFNASDGVSFNFKVPILGWSTAQVQSSETNTNVVSAILTNSANLAVSTSTTILNTVTKDTTGSYNTSTGIYTVPVEGFYDITMASLSLTGAGTIAHGVQKNAGTVVYPWTYSGTGTIGGGATQFYCVAGDTIQFKASGANTMAAGAVFTITRRSGPAQISASDDITASYYISASTQTPGANTPINYDTKIYDSRGAVTTGAGTWKFTAPDPGVYSFTVLIVWSSGTADYLRSYKNGSVYSFMQTVGNSAGQLNVGSNAVDIRLLAGEYVDFRVGSGMVLAGGTAPYSGLVTIKRVGNY